MDDSSDKMITFDEFGVCNYCKNALKSIDSIYFPNVEGERRLQKLLEKIKLYGQNKKYDCIMGLSGASCIL